MKQTITIKQLAALTGTNRDTLVRSYVPDELKQNGVTTELTKEQCRTILLKLAVNGNTRARDLFLCNYKGTEAEILAAIIQKTNLSEDLKSNLARVLGQVSILTNLAKVPASHQVRLLRLFNRLLGTVDTNWSKIGDAAIRLADVTEHCRQQLKKGPIALDPARIERSLAIADDDDTLLLDDDDTLLLDDLTDDE